MNIIASQISNYQANIYKNADLSTSRGILPGRAWNLANPNIGLRLIIFAVCKTVSWC